MTRNPFVLAIATLAISSTIATATEPALTIYRSDNDALFAGGTTPIADGHAFVHEQRKLKLDGGKETVVIDALPAMIDTEAVTIDLGASARVQAQRIVSAGDSGGKLAAYRGDRVQVFSDGTQPIVEGRLIAIDGAMLGVRGDDGHISYVHDYATVRLPDASGLPGSSLQIAVDGSVGSVTAHLTYPTAGLGWRAAYSALMPDTGACTLQLDALASIANRSGGDYSGAHLKLVAGSPNFAKSGYSPPPMRMKAMSAAPESMPEQSALGDYRSYAIDGALDLPDASVTQVPLYPPMHLNCARTWLFENGNAWMPPKPSLVPGASQESEGPITSHLQFPATENLPAGNLHVMLGGRDDRNEFVGGARIADTPKGDDVDVTLGSAFELTAKRHRTEFQVDRAARTMREGFRITLANAGETARTVTVREHPNRWRVWTLASSSQKPSKETPDTLEFRVAVPARGSATVDYIASYAWTAADD